MSAEDPVGDVSVTPIALDALGAGATYDETFGGIVTVRRADFDALVNEVRQVRALLRRVEVGPDVEYDDQNNGRIVPGSQDAVTALRHYVREAS